MAAQGLWPARDCSRTRKRQQRRSFHRRVAELEGRRLIDRYEQYMNSTCSVRVWVFGLGLHDESCVAVDRKKAEITRNTRYRNGTKWRKEGVLTLLEIGWRAPSTRRLPDHTQHSRSKPRWSSKSLPFAGHTRGLGALMAEVDFSTII
jgi:hypothetical protein